MTRPGVLLVSPGVLKPTDLDFGLPHLVGLGSDLKAHLPVRVEIVDLVWEGGDPASLARRLQAAGPFALIGLSCYSSYDYLRCLAVGRFLARLFPGTPLVAGGYHASARPADLLFPGSPFDAVIRGEGERPLRQAVELVLGGGRPSGVLERDLPDRLDDLAPYDWDLLDGYWPRAFELGRKLQIYLSRGCPHHCTFCMERAKSGYAWRAFSPERAVDELRRLARKTDLGRWVVNLADPLFGWPRAWRREVLEGILRAGLAPRQFWTLTRADDLQEDDVALLARARFSIGIGLESGSPQMLERMQKGNRPERYLQAIERLMGLSRKHGLNWAANVIVGHPGETPETLRETYDFLRRLYSGAKETCGWLSVDPFRLYPGSQIHEERAEWERRCGAKFHHPEWWKSWYDAGFRAQHVEPSTTLSYAERVRFMYDRYGPLVADIAARFKGQGRSVDRVFARSVAEQVEQLSPRQRDLHLTQAEAALRRIAAGGGAAGASPAATGGPSPGHAGPPAAGEPRGASPEATGGFSPGHAGPPAAGEPRAAGPGGGAPGRAGAGPGASSEPVAVAFPLGLNLGDAAVRRREGAVRRLLEQGTLRTPAVVEALLAVDPAAHLRSAELEVLLGDAAAEPGPGGAPPRALPVAVYALALEALGLGPGDRALDLGAAAGYVAALLKHIVGAGGDVVAWTGDPTRPAASAGVFDGLFLGGALPRWPRPLAARMHPQGGRAAAFLGPRFAAQDLVCLVRRPDPAGKDAVEERVLARLRVPALTGADGWLRPPR